MPESVLQWGIAVILTMQGWGDWLVGPMNLFTYTGNLEFYLLVLPAIYWCWNARLGVRVGVVLLVGMAINLIVKIAFHDPRPYWLDPQVMLWARPESTFGIPSGHSQNAVAIWGLLAVYGRRAWGWAAAVLLIFLIGLSRMYLGVHFPTDVFTGWALGAIGLALFLQFEQPLLSRLNRWHDYWLVALTLVVSLALILAGWLVLSVVDSNWQLPAEWAQTAALQAPEHPIDPLSLKDLFISMAAFFGLVGGVLVLRRHVRIEDGGPWLKRLGRYPVGVAGVVILFLGLDALFGLLPLAEPLTNFLTFAIIGLWVSTLAPLVFGKLGLAKLHRR